jgi:hypothetical protein
VGSRAGGSPLSERRQPGHRHEDKNDDPKIGERAQRETRPTSGHTGAATQTPTGRRQHRRENTDLTAQLHRLEQARECPRTRRTQLKQPDFDVGLEREPCDAQPAFRNLGVADVTEVAGRDGRPPFRRSSDENVFPDYSIVSGRASTPASSREGLPHIIVGSLPIPHAPVHPQRHRRVLVPQHRRHRHRVKLRIDQTRRLSGTGTCCLAVGSPPATR